MSKIAKTWRFLIKFIGFFMYGILLTNEDFEND